TGTTMEPVAGSTGPIVSGGCGDDAGVLAALEVMVPGLAAGRSDLSEQTLIDVIRELEAVKAAAAAYQARAAVVLRARVIDREREAGVPEAQLGASAGAQLALARRESPFRGGRWMGFSRAVVTEMPHTHRAFRTGRISEWRAMVLVKATACLSVEDRQQVDEALMADAKTTDGVGDRHLEAMARHLAEQADAEAVVRRARKAVGDRHVGLRPAPDTMAILTGVLPVAQAVSVYAALSRAADSASSRGDVRSRGQVMADTLVERVTGRARATDVRLEVQLVMTDRTLFQGDVEPAHLQGYGVVPAQIARDLIRDATRPAGTGSLRVPGDPGGRVAVSPPLAGDPADPGDRGDRGVDRELVWLRRLYTVPGTGALVGLDSKARLFPEGLRRFIELRDQVCARPWCDAPIRQRDHVLAWAAGGPTTAANGAGICVACNHTKEASGWSSRVVDGDRHAIETRTPTGHVYRSQAPALPGTGL
ncbi:HNH endonuclease signature motif containing protein, partial [Corynebacterium sp.]|uniref:HNH endonuclease n=1 Tax=Corynebacterium sp. TaxID=1720 RepID=UPI002648DC88